MAKLITDLFFDDLQIISEGTEGKKDLYIEGVFLQAEKKNRNGRIYPIGILEPVVDDYDDRFIKQKRAIGELNHPASPSVNPERATHLITELKRSNHDFIGKAKILNTPLGNTVRGLIEGGVNLGVSSRGLGSLKEGTGNYSGSKVVQKDFMMVTIDIVSDPSAPDAFVNGIYEAVDYIIANGVIKESEEGRLKAARDIIRKLNRQQISEAKKVANAKALLVLISSLGK